MKRFMILYKKITYNRLHVNNYFFLQRMFFCAETGCPACSGSLPFLDWLGGK